MGTGGGAEGGGERGPSRLDVPRRTAVLAGLGALALLLLVVAVAGGPVDVVTGSGTLGGTAAPPPPVTPTVTTQTPTPAASGNDLAQQLPQTPAALGEVIRAVLVVAAVVVAVLLLRWLWTVVPRYRSRVRTGTLSAQPPEADPEEVVRGADQRLALLLDGEPRNAMVACWVDLEAALERTGLERRPAETPSELTRRVLAVWEVSPRHLDRLADLYREARFSRHPLHEGHREAAVHHLTALHEDLRRVAQRLADERRLRQEQQAARLDGAGAPGGSGAAGGPGADR